MELAQVTPFPIQGNIPNSGGLINPFSTELSLGEIVSKLLPFIFAGAGLILLLNLIYGGISLMLSRGDPKAIEAGKERITTSLIGFIIVFIAYWLVQLLATILRVQFLK